MQIMKDRVTITPLLKARNQLQNAISTADSQLEITGAIKCFEYCYELSWKTMKKILEHMGIEDINSPRAVFSVAYKNKLITNLEVWNSFIQMRNLTSHTYDDQLAEDVFERLPEFARYLDQFIQTIQKL